mmetsp:Transcript_13521/g.31113  ORF Transcript_13521/g.31113 Transcript_13521/m.31113 type:complete len:970 (+) Transcript_13521:62-2971(+)|eukprot:CAMPEP_0114548004 /NCGR_PEP_ID=MMETSP0114-20121206/4752_1 /TAXON_ID=31324 /ORGANISM="Goniomonas sp, Strain m" /LENGTH=969 /DNA_ID=CAMNT_0001732569 /DNA_START=61 /DNA_END=2973 /DNA_ORIENTATION=-
MASLREFVDANARSPSPEEPFIPRPEELENAIYEAAEAEAALAKEAAAKAAALQSSEPEPQPKPERRRIDLTNPRSLVQHVSKVVKQVRTENTEKAPWEGGGSRPGSATESSMTTEEVSLHQLRLLKKRFDEADTDKTAGLDLHEFVRAFSAVFGVLQEDRMVQLFMKIDANSDGTIDWDEFLTYILCQSQAASDPSERADFEEFVHEYIRDLNPWTVHHREPIEHVMVLPSNYDKYVTVGADGSIRSWTIQNLLHLRTAEAAAQSNWVTACCIMPRAHRLVIATLDRKIQQYELAAFDCVQTMQMPHSPLSVTAYVDKVDEYIVIGDQAGFVTIWAMSSSKAVFRKKTHSDWVTKAEYVDDLLSLVSSSLDGTIKIFDVDKKVQKRCLKCPGYHPKGVNSFAYVLSQRLIASCGGDRHIIFWNPYTGKPVVTLSGHSAAVKTLQVNSMFNQLMSFSTNRVVKVWDMRTHRCLQTLGESFSKPADRFSAIAFDAHRGRLLTGSTRLQCWKLQRLVSQAVHATHKAPVVAACYNDVFHQVVSIDENSETAVWDLKTGRLVFNYFDPEASRSKVTCMLFDSSGRRLITGYHHGIVRIWNFSNGHCLNELVYDGSKEISAVAYVNEDGFKNILGVGWDKKVIVWPDEGRGKIEAMLALEGNTDDILCAALLSQGHSIPPIVATGSYDGKIFGYNMTSGSINYTITVPQSGRSSEKNVEQLLFLKKREQCLVCCGSGGFVHFFEGHDGTMLHSFDAGHPPGEALVDMCSDSCNDFLITADSGGFIKIWDISQLKPSDRGTQPMFELYFWKAHDKTVSSVCYVEDSKMVITGSADFSVHVWTIDGVLVGTFGEDRGWRLDNRKTWKATEPRNARGMDFPDPVARTVQVDDDADIEEIIECDESDKTHDLEVASIMHNFVMASAAGRAPGHMRHARRLRIHDLSPLPGDRPKPGDFKNSQKNTVGRSRRALTPMP